MTKAIITTLILTALITTAVTGTMVWLIMDRQIDDAYTNGRCDGIVETMEAYDGITY